MIAHVMRCPVQIAQENLFGDEAHYPLIMCGAPANSLFS
jgi:hypothetical protein